MGTFLNCWPAIVAQETLKITLNPGDTGRLTIAGIAEAAWPNNPIFAKAKAMGLRVGDTVPPELIPDIQDFYENNFWDRAKLDQVNNDDICRKILTTAVNQGEGTAIGEIQLAYDLPVTHVMDQSTLNTLNT